MNAYGGIRTHQDSKRAAADPRHRRHGHKDRLFKGFTVYKIA